MYHKRNVISAWQLRAAKKMAIGKAESTGIYHAYSRVRIRYCKTRYLNIYKQRKGDI